MWTAIRGGVPLAYVTLLTETSTDVSMFRTVLDGSRVMDVDVLVIAGADSDPTLVGSVTRNAPVERYVPQFCWRRCVV